MIKLLLAIDGSKPSQRAAEHVIRLDASGLELSALLLNVPPNLARSRSRAQRRVDMLRALNEWEKATRPAIALLERAHVPYRSYRRSGAPADAILKFVREKECEAIVMGTRGLGAVSGVVLGSVATKVVRLARVPVTLVK